MTAAQPPAPLSWKALAALTLLAALLRLPGLAALPFAPEESPRALPWIEAWLGRGTLAARALPFACALLAVPWVASALASRAGATAGWVAALLVAASPWHLHAARLATLDSALFLASSVALALLLPTANSPRRRLALVSGTIAAAIAFALYASLPQSAGARAFAPLLIGDLGLGVLLLSFFALWLRQPVAGARRALLLGGSLLLAAGGTAPLLRSSAPAVAALLLAAALVLAKLLDATESRRAQLALWAMALVPGLPTLISEHLDGGRYELRPLAAALASERHANEPLFAHSPDFVARELHVAASPLAELIDTPPATGFVLLLLDRGAPSADPPLPPELEARLSLVARTAARRFDLSRYEARLYRWVADR